MEFISECGPLSQDKYKFFIYGNIIFIQGFSSEGDEGYRNELYTYVHCITVKRFLISISLQLFIGDYRQTYFEQKKLYRKTVVM